VTSAISIIAASMADLKNSLELRGSQGSLNDYGFAKLQAPQSDGDIRDYSTWRLEVEDHLSDVSKSTTLEEAGKKLAT
jgi:hypothetical protein